MQDFLPCVDGTHACLTAVMTSGNWHGGDLIFTTEEELSPFLISASMSVFQSIGLNGVVVGIITALSSTKTTSIKRIYLYERVHTHYSIPDPVTTEILIRFIGSKPPEAWQWHGGARGAVCCTQPPLITSTLVESRHDIDDQITTDNVSQQHTNTQPTQRLHRRRRRPQFLTSSGRGPLPRSRGRLD
ncbi:jg16577 [Pararge aegeria aegeria]|uniref:Jg16577 protein n=1 Tax=Pararge aegeria aegeria TaxID=348720 RepID=A0A8S4R7V1_9NEOP|nr:jg16577 [Pararge aegeria aegeria]